MARKYSLKPEYNQIVELKPLKKASYPNPNKHSEMKDSTEETIFQEEQFTEVMDKAQLIMDGFESENVAKNIQAGHAIANLIRSVANQHNTDTVLNVTRGGLPVVANTLESDDAMERISDTFRLLADLLETRAFRRNAAAGLRMASTSIEDDNISGAIASGMEMASKLMEQPAVNTAIDKGGQLASSFLNNKNIQEATRAVLESHTFNRTLNTTMKTGISVAKSLSENQHVCDVTRASMNAVTSILDNKSLQNYVKETIRTSAQVVQIVLDNEIVGNVTTAGANLASALVVNDIVVGAATSTARIASNVLTSQSMTDTLSAVSYYWDTYVYTTQQKLEDLELELEELEEDNENYMELLGKEEIKLAQREHECRVAFDMSRSALRETRARKALAIYKLTTKRLEVERERSKLSLSQELANQTIIENGEIDDKRFNKNIITLKTDGTITMVPCCKCGHNKLVKNTGKERVTRGRNLPASRGRLLIEEAANN